MIILIPSHQSYTGCNGIDSMCLQQFIQIFNSFIKSQIKLTFFIATYIIFCGRRNF